MDIDRLNVITEAVLPRQALILGGQILDINASQLLGIVLDESIVGHLALPSEVGSMLCGFDRIIKKRGTLRYIPTYSGSGRIWRFGADHHLPHYKYKTYALAYSPFLPPTNSMLIWYIMDPTEIGLMGPWDITVEVR